MAQSKKTIFVTGGVLSSIGKGIAAASLGMLLEQRGLKVAMAKMDPYLNVDPGTMSPFQHGEVYVLDDGTETDLDLGHYWRFVQHLELSEKNSFTAGKVYDSVIKRERAGEYLGKTVQVIPHVTDEIKRRIALASEGADVAIIEVGGTVGDIEGLPFFEAIRQVRHEQGAQNVLFIHLTLVPFISAAGELKTKPTQHSVKDLREIGIQPDILICRADRKLDPDIKQKIALFCNLPADHVISAEDCPSIYDVPLSFHDEGLDDRVLEKLGIWSRKPDLSSWKKMVQTLHHSESTIRIGVVGKYTDLKESYKSIAEALVHGAVAHQARVETVFIDSEAVEKGDVADLSRVDGLLVPGGFGSRGVEGKIKAIAWARTQKIPFFGICLGMQLAVIEFARHVAGLHHASSAEFLPDGVENVIDLMASQLGLSQLGGTMRLGAYDCEIDKRPRGGKKSQAYLAYGKERIKERHRHRFEVSQKFRPLLEEKGLWVTGRHKIKDDGDLVEMIEVSDHPFFVGCQFHPELLSQPLNPHPLFEAFVGAAKKYSQDLEKKGLGL